MKNKIKKAFDKFLGRFVVFSAFYADFCLCPKSVIITTLKMIMITPTAVHFLQSKKVHIYALHICTYSRIALLYFGKLFAKAELLISE